MIRPGIMLMNDRGPDGQPWDWKAKLAEWKSYGLQGVDVFQVFLDRTPYSLKDFKAALDDTGLLPSAYCIPTDLVSPDPAVRAKSLDTVRAGLDACRFLGVNHLFSHGGQHANQGDDAFKRYMDGLNQAVALAQEANILFSIENAGKMCNSGDSLAQAVREVPNLKITFDGGNFITCGDEPHTAIMKLREHVAHVHVKSHVPAPPDYPRPYKYCPTGEGHPDYAFIRDMLREVNYDGWFSFEPEGGFDSKWDQSLKTLVSILNG